VPWLQTFAADPSMKPWPTSDACAQTRAFPPRWPATSARRRSKRLCSLGTRSGWDSVRDRFNPTREDRTALNFYPIHGLTSAEHARGVALRLDEAVAQALAQPLTGSVDPEAIPASLAAVAQAHADRIGVLVEEAFHVGIQAAVRAVGDALIGAN
jgi:hypothetical protein